MEGRCSKMSKEMPCSLCPKTFISRQQLSKHKGTHIGGRLYNCPQCIKSFRRSTHLKSHNLIHSGEKSHKCTQSAVNHLVTTVLWRGTPLFTRGRNRRDAHSATFRATMLPTSRCMSKSTSRINYTNVTNVNIQQYNQATWRGTRRATLEKSLSDAQHASIHALQLVN